MTVTRYGFAPHGCASHGEGDIRGSAWRRVVLSGGPVPGTPRQGKYEALFGGASLGSSWQGKSWQGPLRGMACHGNAGSCSVTLGDARELHGLFWHGLVVLGVVWFG